MSEKNEEIIDTETAASILSITPHALRGWVKKEWIPFIKLPGGRLRFRREEVERVLAERTSNRKKTEE
jgi:excisionase family DNA binding protein